MIAFTLPEQIAGVRYALDRLAAEQAAGLAAANGEELARMAQAIGRLKGALATLEWLGRDKTGCVKLLTTRLATSEAVS